MEEYRFIEDKDPQGLYDRQTRESLYWIIEKLSDRRAKRSSLENKVYKKFRGADFGFLLDKNTVSDGIISFQGLLQVDGKFEGEIKGPRKLIVGETGDIVANITVGTLVIKGAVRGSVVATCKAEIHAAGRFDGAIKTPSLSIEKGALFMGKCHMIKSPESVSKVAKKKKRRFSALGAGFLRKK
ncbi:MAG: polymer-forming cytoskeletal protein [Nitrospinales bacterium]